jgi:hypothetical protein
LDRNFNSVVGEGFGRSKECFHVSELRKWRDGIRETGVVLNMAMLSQGSCWITLYENVKKGV